MTVEEINHKGGRIVWYVRGVLVGSALTLLWCQGPAWLILLQGVLAAGLNWKDDGKWWPWQSDKSV